MSSKENELYLEWIKKANDDLLSLESLVRHRDGSPATGCFLAQQAVEKLPKALIIMHGIELEKVHGLIVLFNKVKTSELEIRQFSEGISVLNRYYIETRYPGDYPEFSWGECQNGLDTAKRIYNFVNGRLSGKSD